MSFPLESARMADRIEKTFTLSGPAATEVAQFLGMNLNQKNSLELPLGPYGKEDRWSSPEASGVVKNHIQYRPGPTAQLILKGVWVDQLTGSGLPTPAYHFSSPSIEDPKRALEWQKILDKLLALKKPPADDGYLIREWQTPNTQSPWLTIRLYESRWKTLTKGQYPYHIYIGFDDQSWEVRKTRLRKYWERPREIK